MEVPRVRNWNSKLFIFDSGLLLDSSIRTVFHSWGFCVSYLTSSISLSVWQHNENLNLGTLLWPPFLHFYWSILCACNIDPLESPKQQPLFWLLALTTTLLISFLAFAGWLLPTFVGPTFLVKQTYLPGAFCKGDLAVTPQNPILAGTHSYQMSAKTFSSPLDLWKAATPHTPTAPTRYVRSWDCLVSAKYCPCVIDILSFPLSFTWT